MIWLAVRYGFAVMRNTQKHRHGLLKPKALHRLLGEINSAFTNIQCQKLESFRQVYHVNSA